MSVALAMGFAGMAIAPYIGVTLATGWLLGTVAASLLFAPSGPDGPRIQDLKPQSSEYGRPIPIVYSKMALGGNIIWASELIEVKQKVGGSLFGGGQTVYSYYGNMAVAVCEGEVTFGRIWAGPERRLIYDPGTGQLEGSLGPVDSPLDFHGYTFSNNNIRFYTGSETQEPDALIESYEGVGKVPAFRGIAYLVLERFALAKDGNRLPQLLVEVGKNIQATPAIGTKWIANAWVVGDYWVVAYWGGGAGILIRRLADDSQVNNYWTEEYSMSFDWRMDRLRFLLFIPTGLKSLRTFDLTTSTENISELNVPASADQSPAYAQTMQDGVHHAGYYVLAAIGSSPSRLSLWLVDPDSLQTKRLYTTAQVPDYCGPLLAPTSDANKWVYALTPTRIYKLALEPGLPILAQQDHLAGGPTYAPVNAQVDPRTGYIWIIDDTYLDPYVGVTVFDQNLNLLYRQVLQFTGYQIYPRKCVFYNNGSDKVAINCERWLAIPFFIKFSASNPAAGPLESVDGAYHGTGDINEMFQNPVTGSLYGLRYGATLDITPSFAAAEPENLPTQFDPLYSGDAQFESEYLSTILIDLAGRAGIAQGNVDVTELVDTKVLGYAVSSQTTVRDATQALAPHFFFDAVESQGKIKYVTRGGKTPELIPEDDLGAHESGAEPEDALTVTRAMDQEMPHTLTVNYLSEARKYEVETKYARRLIRSEGNEMVLDAPIVMSDKQAAVSASVNLFGAWTARRSYKFSLPLKYAYLEPTDLVSIRGQIMRLVSIKQSAGRFQIEAKADDPYIYEPVVQTTPLPPALEQVQRGALTYLEVL